MNEIIYGKYLRAWKNLKGLSSDSAVSWNKMNLTLPCENLTFYSLRLISNRSSVRKMELVPRKFWQTNCKQFKIILHYILNLHTYILPILHSLWSWTMRKSKSRAEEMIFTARKNVSTVEVKLKGIGSQSLRTPKLWHHLKGFCLLLTYLTWLQSYSIFFLKKNMLFCFNFWTHSFLDIWIALFQGSSNIICT